MNIVGPEMTVKLRNGVEMPIFGLGTCKLTNGGEIEEAVKNALRAGYRLFDTASIYGNEVGLGKAVSEYGLLREEYFITTKVYNTEQGYENTLKAIDKSLERLGLTYVDLYLIHWPSASENDEALINKRAETWQAMEEILNMGKAKAIGVSNYTVAHLEEMKSYANTLPAVNQVEFHPFLYQNGLLAYCKENNIILEAYSPLTQGKKLDHVYLLELANKYHKTPAQIMLRWGIQHGVVVIPKSSKKEHIEENINVFNFKLNEDEMRSLDNLNENKHFESDPTKLA